MKWDSLNQQTNLQKVKFVIKCYFKVDREIVVEKYLKKILHIGDLGSLQHQAPAEIRRLDF